MKMFRIIILLTLILCASSSCTREKIEAEIHTVNVQLVYPEDYTSTDSVKVLIGDYYAYTDTNGLAAVTLPIGTYTLRASESRSINGTAYNFNASNTISVTEDSSCSLELVVSKASQLIIKEVYIGGCQKDDGSGAFTKDAYIIIYNNLGVDAVIDTNICIAFSYPYNSNATNNYLDGNGNLTHSEWIPASAALWHFTNKITIAPGKQILLPIYQAIDQTSTYSNSVDLSNSEYYPMYDFGDFNNSSYYAAPSEKIPTTHYLNAIKYGIGNAWSLSQSSPALFIFATKEMGPAAFGTDASYVDYYGGSTNQVSQKVPIDWVIDGVDIFRQGYDDKNSKRFPDNVDAGNVLFTNNYGHTVYRNVDKEATEGIAGNDGLIVYNYNGGTDNITGGTTDPSGIDAEASIANGARIVYKDTNNSSNDFHQRATASIK